MGLFLPDEVVTVTVVIAEDDGTVEKPVGIGTGTGMLAVEETVTVLWLAADEDSEAAAPTVEVTVLWVEAAEIALYALESTLVTEVVTVEMAVGMGIGTGTITGPDAAEVLMPEEADELVSVTDDAAGLGLE